MLGRRVGLLFLLAGCAALAGCDLALGLGPIPDGSVSGDTPPGDARVCARGAPFGSPVPVPIDGAYSVEGARFTPDGNSAYLSLCPLDPPTSDPQELKARCDLYTSLYTPSTGLFTSFALLGASAPGYDSYPTITPDTNHLIFGTSRFGAVQIAVATKQGGMFPAAGVTRPQLFPSPPQGSNEPYILGDGRTLYFAATISNARWQLYRSTGGPPAFGPSAEVAGVNTTAFEMAPVVRDDEREIFFATNRGDPDAPDAIGALDIYAATRDDADLPFGTPVKLDALSTTGTDWPLWLSPDGCELFFINKAAGLATLKVARR